MYIVQHRYAYLHILHIIYIYMCMRIIIEESRSLIMPGSDLAPHTHIGFTKYRLISQDSLPENGKIVL
jgi:hypothetical protein